MKKRAQKEQADKIIYTMIQRGYPLSRLKNTEAGKLINDDPDFWDSLDIGRVWVNGKWYWMSKNEYRNLGKGDLTVENWILTQIKAKFMRCSFREKLEFTVNLVEDIEELLQRHFENVCDVLEWMDTDDFWLSIQPNGILIEVPRELYNVDDVDAFLKKNNFVEKDEHKVYKHYWYYGE